MTRNANRFQKGTGAYVCTCCKRTTRSTGRGDNEHAGVCAECFDLQGEENSLSDTGEFYDSPANVIAMIDTIAARGGDASVWDDMRKRAADAMLAA